jgi:hypothetical protein
MNKFDIAALGAEGIAVVIMVLAITALFGKRIYDCYLAGGMRIGKMNRDKQTLTMRSMLAVYPAALALPLSLPPFVLEVNAALWTVVGATIATIAPAVYIYLKANWANDDVQKATDYTAVALGNFDKFIHTGGDLIGRKDLKIAIENGPTFGALSSSGVEVAKYLLANFEDIGHVISKSSKKALMPAGVTGGVYATKKTVRFYGISREDLKNYPNVVRKRNARWL